MKDSRAFLAFGVRLSDKIAHLFLPLCKGALGFNEVGFVLYFVWVLLVFKLCSSKLSLVIADLALDIPLFLCELVDLIIRQTCFAFWIWLISAGRAVFIWTK